MRVFVIGNNENKFDDMFEFFQNDKWLDLTFNTFIPENLDDFSVICNLEIENHKNIEHLFHIPIICTYEMESSMKCFDNIIFVCSDSYMQIKQIFYNLKDLISIPVSNIEVLKPSVLQNVTWFRVDPSPYGIEKMTKMLNRYVEEQQLKMEISQAIQGLIIEILSIVRDKTIRAQIRMDKDYIDLKISGYTNLSSYFINRFADAINITDDTMQISWVNS